MKNNEKLLSALSGVDDCYIDAAYNRKSNKRRFSGILEVVGPVAAVAAVAAFAVFLGRFAQKDSNISAMSDTTVENTVTETSEDTTLDYNGDYNTEEYYNMFICGDQKVFGLEGLICDSYDLSDDQHVEVDGYGISQELISMENPPTIYYKQGDTIEFITPSDKSFNCFQLWYKNGQNTIATKGHLYGYLDENPGEYYLTAKLKQGNRYTSMGVKLVVTGEKTEGLIFMTPAELEGVTAIHVTSEPAGYDFRFNGAEMKPIIKYLSSLRPVSVNTNKVNDVDSTTWLIDITNPDGTVETYPVSVSMNKVKDIVGMTWVIELTYADGTVETIYHMGNIYISKGDDALYELSYDEASRFDRIVKGTAIPDDFSFSLVWGCYGVSSYDSKTAKLIKTKDATDISKYTTTYKMTDAELERAFRLLSDVIYKMPDKYDPYNDPSAEHKISSEPSQTIIVTVTANGITKTVECKDVCLTGTGYDETAKTFLSAVNIIKNILTNTNEWKALPDYEFYYE